MSAALSLVRIGTRGSRLALAQANEVRRRLKARYPRLHFRLVVIKTMGDEFQTVELFKKTNIGVFTKTIEEKLMKKEIDIAVHSLKDLPTELAKGLCLAAFPKRLDTRDVLISRQRFTLSDLPKGATVGTGSPRRKSQLRSARPDLALCDMRGNLDTRISKVLKEKKLDAIVVVRAGLVRLKKYLKHAVTLSPRQVLPAVGQGALGLETRKGDSRILKMVRCLNHPPTEKAVLAERGFLQALEGGCRVPVGIYSKVRAGKLFLEAAVFSVKENAALRGAISGPLNRAATLGATLARDLLKKGAVELMREAREGGRE